MEVDLASVEVVFAQKLACGEPTTRQRALKVLHDWIREQSATKPFGEEDLMRLCKGLHYVMWMQDKMLLQEELANRIAGLINIFKSEDEKVMYVKCFLNSLSKEWPNIDRWRMDKFLMEIRRMLRSCFAHLNDLKWKKEYRDKYWKVFEETAISSDNSFNEGLKFHIASIFLDELDNAGGLTKKQVTICLKPYANLLGKREISQYLFDSVATEVFDSILHEKSEQFAAKEAGEPMEEGSIGFNYKEISELLFEVGKRPELNAKRRKRVYDLVKKFEICELGGDPFNFVPKQPSEVLKKNDIEEAAKRIIETNESFKKDKIKSKKEKMMLRRKALEEAEKLKNAANTEEDTVQKTEQKKPKKKIILAKKSPKSKTKTSKIPKMKKTLKKTKKA